MEVQKPEIMVDNERKGVVFSDCNFFVFRHLLFRSALF